MHTASVADVFRVLTRVPGRPRLTWYGEGGERVELSGAVLENWVNKTANLLVEEFDVDAGTRLALDLPPHWRTVVWALAAWRVGACVDTRSTSGTTSTADIVVTSRPDHHASAEAVVAVALPALARRFPTEIPAGAIDAAAAVMTYGDTLGWVPETCLASAALITPSTSLTHAGLLGEAHRRSTPPGARVLLEPRRDTEDQSAEFLLAVLAALAADGSVVGLAAPVSASLVDEPGRRERLVATERITVS